ncbi:MAG: type II CAAX endopeptidase family protein [Gallicola sp.]|nr:type II CAAX endopeptidase family protein [Gallicola sp.]
MNFKFLYLFLYIVLLFTPIGNFWQALSFSMEINNEMIPLLNYLLLGLLGLLVFRREYRESLKKSIRKPGRFGIRLIGVYVGTLVLGGILVTLFQVQSAQNQDLVVSVFKNVPLPLSLIGLGIGGPITEECIYRELLIGKAGKKFNRVFLSMISILLFSWVHVMFSSLREIVVYIPMAIGFVYLYTKEEGGLFSSTMGHIMRNTLSALLMIYII